MSRACSPRFLFYSQGSSYNCSTCDQVCYTGYCTSSNCVDNSSQNCNSWISGCESVICANVCSGSGCSGGCTGGCTYTCASDACKSSCIDSCSNDCGTTCSNDCGKTCSDTCTSACKYSCITACTATCGSDCSGTCKDSGCSGYALFINFNINTSMIKN